MINIKNIAKEIVRPLWVRIQYRIAEEARKQIHSAIGENNSEIEERIHSAISENNLEIKERIHSAISESNSKIHSDIVKFTGGKQYRPILPVLWEVSTPFMAYSTCSTADFLHPRFSEICAMINHPPIFQRKLWEWVFIIHHLLEAGAIGEGKRGLVFGVGQEKLPALFASLGSKILATDAPAEMDEMSGWKETGQYSSELSTLRYSDIVSDELFDANVSYMQCDMNNIDNELKDFDFNWSSCCFEHLGSLDAGIEFVINCVEKSLKIGGVAVHTTEFNMSSNKQTLDTGATVIYRKRDMEELVSRLRKRGHDVRPFVIAPDSHMLDFYCDVPPYTHRPHIKLEIEGFVCTSAGLVVRRGR